MRVLQRSCLDARKQIGQAPWESFQAEKNFTFVPPINWTTFAIAVQYRDSNRALSPVYCASIGVEGEPPRP